MESDISVAELAQNLRFAHEFGTTTITGYLRDRGFGPMTWRPTSFFSSDLDPNMQLNGVVVPEPASIVLLVGVALCGIGLRPSGAGGSQP